MPQVCWQTFPAYTRSEIRRNMRGYARNVCNIVFTCFNFICTIKTVKMYIIIIEESLERTLTEIKADNPVL